MHIELQNEWYYSIICDYANFVYKSCLFFCIYFLILLFIYIFINISHYIHTKLEFSAIPPPPPIKNTKLKLSIEALNDLLFRIFNMTKIIIIRLEYPRQQSNLKSYEVMETFHVTLQNSCR